LIRSIGSNGAEVYLSGIEFAHEQSMSPRVPVQEVPMKQRFILAPDGRYVLQTEEPYPGNVVFRFRTVGSRSGAATFDELMWRTGSEIQRSSAQQAMEDYQSLLLLCPALLAVDAMRHPLTVDTRNAQNGTLNFSYTDSLGQLVSVAVDASSGSIESVTTGNQHYRYSAWRTKHGLLQPARIEGNNGGADSTWIDVDATAKQTFPDADFAIPAGYADGPPPLGLHLASLGHGAYRVDGASSGYHTGVVVGRNCIALLDPSVSVAEASNVRHLVQQSFPGRPIRYIVLSHVHGDHIAGLPVYFEAEVKIIAGAEAHVALKRRFPAMNLNQLQELDQSSGSNQSFRIDLGGKQLQVYPVQSTHASSMLVSYDAQSRTLFQGDLFFLPEVGPTPPAFEGAEELASLISKNHWIVGMIVGVHGRSGRSDDLTESLALRKAGRTFSTEPPILMPSSS
jgi:glyoxylase-like metal-dependent hydrolase (beta-lactamase superfamily II)